MIIWSRSAPTCVSIVQRSDFPAMLFVSEQRRHTVTAFVSLITCVGGIEHLRAGPPLLRPEVVIARTRVGEGRDISFRRFPTTAGLSQTRVSEIAQDDDGFLGFGTQSGLNRYDGYKCKVF